MSKPQSYKNHASLVPAFHFVALPLTMVLLIYYLVQLVREPSVANTMAWLVVLVLNIATFYARVFAIGVQDRVIRLEERMRLERLLPAEQKGRIMDFTTEQLIGMRFASDAELPALARRVLDEGIADRKTIKQAVVSWKVDTQRI